MRKFALVVFLLLLLAAFNPTAHARPDRSNPGKVAEVFNYPVSGNASVCTTSLTPQRASVAYRVTVAIQATNSIFELRVTGATDLDFDFNNGTELTAGRLYTFTFGASDTYTYNFQFETGCTIGYLLVEEIQSDEL